jgi:hypothetical protein
MFKSIVRPLRVWRFSKTVSLPQSNSSLTPSTRQRFNFDKPPDARCLAQPPAWSKRSAAPPAISEAEQTQRTPLTRDFSVRTRDCANAKPR